jgi:hypothetical protein
MNTNSPLSDGELPEDYFDENYESGYHPRKNDHKPDKQDRSALQTALIGAFATILAALIGGLALVLSGQDITLKVGDTVIIINPPPTTISTQGDPTPITSNTGEPILVIDDGPFDTIPPTNTLMATPNLSCRVSVKDRANIRPEPSMSSTPLRVEYKGAEFVAIGQIADEWWKILYSEDVAWVAKSVVIAVTDCGDVPPTDGTTVPPSGTKENDNTPNSPATTPLKPTDSDGQSTPVILTALEEETMLSPTDANSDELPTDPTVAQPTVAQPTAAQPTAAQPTIAQPTIAQPTIAQPTIAQPTVAQPTVAQPTVAQPTVAQPTVAQPTVAQPTVAQPTIAQPTVAQPTSGPNYPINPVEVCWKENQNESTTVWRVTNNNSLPLQQGLQAKVMFDFMVYGAGGTLIQSEQRWDQTGQTQISTSMAETITLRFYVWDNGNESNSRTISALSNETFRCK